MGNKRYWLSMGEMVAVVQEELRGFLGVATDFCNHNAVIECTVNELINESKGLYPPSEIFIEGSMPPWTSMQNPVAVEIFLSYGLPPEFSRELASFIKRRINDMLIMLVGGLSEENDYSFRSNENGDILLEDKGPIVQFRPREEVNELLEKIKEDIDNGDWYPEHIRRLVGR